MSALCRQIVQSIHTIQLRKAKYSKTNLPNNQFVIIFVYRRKREKERGEKRRKMDTILESYFLQTNPKSRLFQNVKEVPTNGIPKIRRCLKRIFLNSRNMDYFYIGADLWNSNSRDYLVSIPIFGIPNIWEFHLYQYLAVRVKC